MELFCLILCYFRHKKQELGIISLENQYNTYAGIWMQKIQYDFFFNRKIQ